MNTQIKELLKHYGISHDEVAEKVPCSRPLVSRVLAGTTPDRRGVMTAALDLIEEIKQEQDKERARLNALMACEAA